MTTTTGFSQQELVIYKLGQIESQLASLLVKITENNTAVQDQFRDMDVAYSAMHDRIVVLEKKYDVAMAKFVGGAAVVAFIVSFFKTIIFNWLGIPNG